MARPANFRSKYLDAASTGLHDFIQLRSLTASSLSQMVTAYPRYFASIRSSNLAFATDSSTAKRIRANFATIKSLYPPSVFPPVTLLIGRFSTGGTTSTNGMLIGSEFYSEDRRHPARRVGGVSAHEREIGRQPADHRRARARAYPAGARERHFRARQQELARAVAASKAARTSSGSGRRAGTSTPGSGRSRSRWNRRFGRSSPARCTAPT